MSTAQIPHARKYSPSLHSDFGRNFFSHEEIPLTGKNRRIMIAKTGLAVGTVNRGECFKSTVAFAESKFR
ncbi:hypothetical protein [Aureimonas leprariae]|uniref:Uncharacterized protein n=1 Tax=Plantimonas leprariae TaxID=2615207 RepID=A0A7V7PTA2_9HYPH|nr:hypothetical protein [Aureimonas leprariae]KAB0682739.1 hypothetical protein F6X38_01255 [Aureimonas leprariae]